MGLVRRWRAGRAPARLAARLIERSEALIAEQRLESDVLLDVANRYANEIVAVRSDAEGRVAVQALARGYALRVAEEQEGLAGPVAAEMVDHVGASVRAGREPAGAVADAVRSLASSPVPDCAIGAGGWARAVRGAKEAARRSAPEGVAVDAGAALRFGYEARRAEAALGLADAGLFGMLGVVAIETLLENADAAIASGDAMFTLDGARVALVMGALHGLALEGGAAPARETAVAAARAGYALRRAEETVGSIPADVPRLRAWLQRAIAARVDVPEWDALQVLAWEVADRVGIGTGGGPPAHDDAPGLADITGHPDRGGAFADLADAVSADVGAVLGGLAPGDVLRAVRFGYALRAAERSLPDGARARMDTA